MKIYKGICTSGDMNWKITVDDKPINLRHDLRNHSPDGGSWGYFGSGPAQCALAILADYLQDDERALEHYQNFKFKIIGQLPMDECWEMTGDDIQKVIDELESK